ncbi:MAG TPA: hypothetical protein VJO53_13470 [Candidatus Acidoferrales bacterium]|nr:hypothetical protein [Candidatus Acidoferrales bacterium]
MTGRALVLRFSMLLCFLAPSAFAGTVTGTIMNGTTGKPAAGVDVILIQLQGGMQPVAKTQTDSEGHYKLDNPSLGTAPMLIRAVYRGVNYHEPATPDKTTVDVEVFEPTEKAGAFAVTGHAVVLQPSGSDLVINEVYLISNKTHPPAAYYRADGSFLFSLPQGAQLGDVSAVGTSGMPVRQSPIDKGKNEQAIVFPFRPGESRVEFSYRVPYAGDQAALRLVSHYAVDRLGIFAPPSVQVTAAGFTSAGEDQGMSVYTRQSVAANAPISVLVAGTAPPPAQESGTSANAGADDTQNPSVNSRIESGAGAPVASVTTLPARLDSLKWYVVAGFSAIFALGLLYLWRLQQMAGAAASDSSSGKASLPREEPKPAAPPRAAAPRKAAPPSPSPERVATAVDRDVRGSLDELKDSLFRLELRREAGTIAEEDYARERDRVQKVLRDLVKG